MRLRSLGRLCLAAFVVGITPSIMHAQDKPHPVLGIGSFLTRDRGWNFELNIAASAGVDYPLTRVLGVRGLAIMRAGGLGQGSMPVIPEPPQSIENGLTLALHLRTQPGPLGLYLLSGPEYFRVWGERRVTGGRVAAAVGVGTAWGVRRRWAMEARYARYTRSIGSTRGHLDVSLLRQF